MAFIKFEDVADTLAFELYKKYPDEGILQVEVQAIIQAIFTSLRWAHLRKAKEEGLEDLSDTSIETDIGFANKWMDKKELVDRITHTSGLDRDICSYALKMMESIIVIRLKHESSITVEEIGTIDKQSGKNGYRITLATVVMKTNSASVAR